MKADSFTRDASRPLPAWITEKGGTRRESSGSRVSKDEEIRTDQPQATQQADSSSAARITYVHLSLLSPFYWLAFLLSQFIRLSTVSPYQRSVISVQAYLSVALPHLQLKSLLLNNLVLLYVSLPPCVWLSLSILQHLLSEISLSSVRWCWEQPSLYPPFPSDPPCFSLFPFLTSTRAFNRLFYSETSTNAPVSLYLLLSSPMSPLCLLSISAVFSLDLSLTESCPSKPWVLLCLFASASLAVNNRFCSFDRTKFCGRM